MKNYTASSRCWNLTCSNILNFRIPGKAAVLGLLNTLNSFMWDRIWNSAAYYLAELAEMDRWKWVMEVEMIKEMTSLLAALKCGFVTLISKHDGCVYDYHVLLYMYMHSHLSSVSLFSRFLFPFFISFFLWGFGFVISHFGFGLRYHPQAKIPQNKN